MLYTLWISFDDTVEDGYSPFREEGIERFEYVHMGHAATESESRLTSWAPDVS